MLMLNKISASVHFVELLVCESIPLSVMSVLMIEGKILYKRLLVFSFFERRDERNILLMSPWGYITPV